MPRLLLYLVLLAGLFTVNAQYRTDTTLFRVELRDGNVFKGSIIGDDGTRLIFQTQTVGILHINKSDIKVIQMARPDHSDQKPKNYNFLTSSYFNLPSGYGMSRGEVVFKNSMLVINHLSVGVTDRFSMGGGTIPFFALGSPNSPIWITPKYSIPLVANKVNLSLTGIAAGITGFPEVSTLLKGTLTLGPRDRNISLGLAYGFYDGRTFNIPITTLSGLLRTSENHFLMGESYLSSEFRFAFLGGRWQFAHVTMDYGAAILTDYQNVGGIPWLSFLVPIQLAKTKKPLPFTSTK
jgi:hypothetical protein